MRGRRVRDQQQMPASLAHQVVEMKQRPLRRALGMLDDDGGGGGGARGKVGDVLALESGERPASRENRIHTGWRPTRSPTSLGDSTLPSSRWPIRNTTATLITLIQSGGNCANAIPIAKVAPTRVPTKGMKEMRPAIRPMTKPNCRPTSDRPMP